MHWISKAGKTLKLMVGDITEEPVDAIVNAANSGLVGGGGVDGAIHEAGGPAIMRELGPIRSKSGGCPTGSAVVTSAGNLPARFVFHAVGPVYRDGKHGEPDLLASCYRTCLQLAEECAVRSISFPAISTGVYGYPLNDAAAVAVREIVAHLQRGGGSLVEVLVVLYDQRSYNVHAQALESYTLAPKPY